MQASFKAAIKVIFMQNNNSDSNNQTKTLLKVFEIWTSFVSIWLNGPAAPENDHLLLQKTFLQNARYWFFPIQLQGKNAITFDGSDHDFLSAKNVNAGLVVMGDDSWSKGRGFKSWRSILDGIDIFSLFSDFWNETHLKAYSLKQASL